VRDGRRPTRATPAREVQRDSLHTATSPVQASADMRYRLIIEGAKKTLDGWKKPPLMADPGHGLSGDELGRPPPGLQLARRAPRPTQAGRGPPTAGPAVACPFAGRDRHGGPLRTKQCFCRLLRALHALATPEAVLGECLAVLLRLWIVPQRNLHWCAGQWHQQDDQRGVCDPVFTRPDIFSVSTHRR